LSWKTSTHSCREGLVVIWTSPEDGGAGQGQKLSCCGQGRI
jgi:hypothetical protein